MKAAKSGTKCSQPWKEGLPQKNTAEQEGYAGAYTPLRITENNITNAEMSKEGLLDRILDRNNMNQAYRRVKSNKGGTGIDGMGVDELLPYLREHGRQLIQAIKDGKFHPNPIRRVETPKEKKPSSSISLLLNLF